MQGHKPEHQEKKKLKKKFRAGQATGDSQVDFLNFVLLHPPAPPSGAWAREPSTSPGGKRHHRGTSYRPAAPRDRGCRAGRVRGRSPAARRAASPHKLISPPPVPAASPTPGGAQRRGSRPPPPDPSAPRAGARAQKKVAEKLSVEEGAGVRDVPHSPGRSGGAAQRGEAGGGRPGPSASAGAAAIAAASPAGLGSGDEAGSSPASSRRGGWEKEGGREGSRAPPAPPGAAATRGGKGGRSGREEGRGAGGGSRALRCVRGAGASLREEEEIPRPYGRALRRAPRPLLRSALPPAPAAGPCAAARLAAPPGRGRTPRPSRSPRGGARRPPWSRAGGSRPLIRAAAHRANMVEESGVVGPTVRCPALSRGEAWAAARPRAATGHPVSPGWSRGWVAGPLSG